MTREELKQYISEAVDALEQQDIEQLFPQSSQPDLYSVVKELVGLKGELRKLAKSTLKMNNQVQSVLELQKQETAKIVPIQQNKQNGIDEELREVLQKIIKQDDIWQRTNEHFKELPELSIWTYQQYKQHFSAWKKGYDIAYNQWQQLIKSIGFYKTGLPGQIFDPLIHEAIATKSVAEKPNNIILETELEGYVYKQKLVQRAKVVVNKKNENT